MGRKNTIPFHESFQIGILLAVVGGFLDAYTYLLKGNVFANAQTGNLVLLGIELAQGRLQPALYYFVPIAAFALGVIVTELVKRHERGAAYFRWQHIILIIEMATLFLLGCLPPTVPNGIINVTISFVCSIQVCSFRTLVDTPYATTMCTGNLRSATEQLFRFITDHDRDAGRKALRYFLVILCFCAGAGAGALLAEWWKERSIWFASFVLGAVLVLMTLSQRKAKKEQLSLNAGRITEKEARDGYDFTR